jgi:hypothetical protein
MQLWNETAMKTFTCPIAFTGINNKNTSKSVNPPTLVGATNRTKIGDPGLVLFVSNMSKFLRRTT